MTKIIGLSGKKQAGKGEVCKHFLAEASVYWPQTWFFLSKPILTTRTDISIFPLAGPLKKLCVDILGLEECQVYGTDEQKNSLTRYRWEDLPHYTNIALYHSTKAVEVADESDYCPNTAPYLYQEVIDSYLKRNLPKGLMTARQVLQEVGTGIFRKMNANVWNEALLLAIKNANPDVALIDDVRFPDEVEAIQKAGGVVLRLTRDVNRGADQHASECALDQDCFDWAKFDAVIKNDDLTIDEQNILVVKALKDLGVIES